jgi:hypothetical protein
MTNSLLGWTHGLFGVGFGIATMSLLLKWIVFDDQPQIAFRLLYVVPIGSATMLVALLLSVWVRRAERSTTKDRRDATEA